MVSLLLGLSVLLSSVPVTLAAGRYSNAGRSKSSPYMNAASGSVVYASQGELKHVESPTGEASALPPTNHFEMLRFVTAYRTGIEAMVDMTPYTPLIRAAVAVDNLTMYSFIDSWVNNHTESHILYLNNVTDQCHLRQTSDGNGWSLSASLLFWPREDDHANVSTAPRESITLSSGWIGGRIGIGAVRFHTANVSESGGAVRLDKAVDFSTVKVATVYDLTAENAEFAALLGFVAQQTEYFTRSGNEQALNSTMEEIFESLMYQGLASVHVTHSDNDTHTVTGTYNGSLVEWKRRMPVYYQSSDIFTDTNLQNGWWMNSSMPLKPVGFIKHADGENATCSGLCNVSIHLNHHCLPGNWSKGLPGLLIPRSDSVLHRVRALLRKVKEIGLQSAASDSRGEQPRLLELDNGTLVAPALLGHIDLAGAEDGDATENTWERLLLKTAIGPEMNISDGRKVMVLTKERHGHLLKRNFDLPNLVFGDRIILQLAVTGHGWASTQEQCGEYCHAVYRMKLNGRSFANVTQFRDDCKDNPINGSVQYGTWDESRNGWCPGTVVPGLFIDITNHVDKGANRLDIDLVVWSNVTLDYEPYTDYAGFVFNDAAILGIGTTAFVYDESAVQAVRSQERALTAAEAALRDGCSAPERLTPPAFIDEASTGQVFLQVGAKAVTSTQIRASQQHATRSAVMRRDMRDRYLEEKEPLSLMGQHFSQSRSRIPFVDFEKDRLPSAGPRKVERTRLARSEIKEDGDIGTHRDVNRHYQHAHQHAALASDVARPFDYEARAPWYLYNETVEGHLQGVTKVELFASKLMQAASRNVHVHVDKASVPSEWSKVALHFRLHKPDHLEYDHWDRVGSFGLRFAGL